MFQDYLHADDGPRDFARALAIAERKCASGSNDFCGRARAFYLGEAEWAPFKNLRRVASMEIERCGGLETYLESRYEYEREERRGVAVEGCVNLHGLVASPNRRISWREVDLERMGWALERACRFASEPCETGKALNRCSLGIDAACPWNGDVSAEEAAALAQQLRADRLARVKGECLNGDFAKRDQCKRNLEPLHASDTLAELPGAQRDMTLQFAWLHCQIVGDTGIPNGCSKTTDFLDQWVSNGEPITPAARAVAREMLPTPYWAMKKHTCKTLRSRWYCARVRNVEKAAR